MGVLIQPVGAGVFEADISQGDGSLAVPGGRFLPSERWKRQTLQAVSLFFITALILMSLRPLLPIDETRYLSVAWEMWAGGSKFVPHLNGDIYGHKPPLLFWLINAVWAVTGVNEFAARLVAPIFAAFGVVLTALLARRLWPEAPDRAGLSAIILATSGTVLAFGSAVMFDALLTVAVLMSLGAVWQMAKKPDRRLALGLAAALALGVFAKGPVVLVHVLPTALAMPLWADKSRRSGLRPYYASLAIAIVAALAIVLIWLGPALILGGAEYRDEVLWKQSAGRMVSSFAHNRPFWFFIALAPLFLWPWGWGQVTVRTPSPTPAFSTAAARFLLIWAGFSLLAFSIISGKQIHYLFPEIPALALLLSGSMTGLSRSWFRYLATFPAVLMIAFAAANVAGLLPDVGVRVSGIGSLELTIATILVAGMLVGLTNIPSPVWGMAAIGPVTLIAFEILMSNGLWQANDPSRIATELAGGEARGLATTDMNYAGQFTFSARLTKPLARLGDRNAVQSWSADHPGGLILAKERLDVSGLIRVAAHEFHGDDYWLYQVAE